MPEALQTPDLPSEKDAALARATSRQLTPRLRSTSPLSLRMGKAPQEETVQLPAAAVRMLVRILEEMALGNTMTLVPVHAELTTQEAADLLNISRPTLIQLLEDGKIEYRKVGTHRRVRFESVVQHKRSVEAARRAALAELAAYDQELGI